MTTETLNQLHSKALKLPEAERTELAHTLVASLNALADANAVEEVVLAPLIPKCKNASHINQTGRRVEYSNNC